ncbi:hypothetical protein AVEN_108183-1 [Araneus ventricosus]|uniref:LRRCT domain-containing protein n=1 Tax=Araneus ventricosus TaxID=182803 RepID=A0A4Y2RPM3_ARAVE|nr:hypothetical protein AVEN_108183-1 [Araneus ventricosus]
MWHKLFLTSFVILVQEGICLTGGKKCPVSEDVDPCYCYYLSGHAYLTCQNFTDSEVLRRIFNKSQSYEFTVVVIEDSILEYLPHQIIDSVQIRELQLKKTTLQQAFDQTPLALDSLHALIIDDITIERLDDPSHRLDALSHRLDALSHRLDALSHRLDAPTQGTFAEFKKLVKIEVDGGQIEVLTRDIFPTPFNGRYIYFNDQKLREIPDGLFSQMPNLCIVSFKKNQIAILPERAFDIDITGKVSIFLNENPLKCDCQMIWLIQKKPRILQGKCESPKRFHGKELNELAIQDFNC